MCDKCLIHARSDTYVNDSVFKIRFKYLTNKMFPYESPVPSDCSSPVGSVKIPCCPAAPCWIWNIDWEHRNKYMKLICRNKSL